MGILRELADDRSFALGQKVRLTRPTGPNDVFTVKACLPAVDGDRQYRVKSDREPFERVVREHELQPE